MTTPSSSSSAPAIDAPLPSDVSSGGLSRFAAYQRYPAFTWPWFIRRSYVFWPFAAADGVFMAVWHASSMTTWADAIPLGARAVTGCLIIVSAGPLLAASLRYLRLPRGFEILAVCLAIALGLVVADAAGRWVDDYHNMLMARLHGGTMSTPAAVQGLSRALGELMGQFPHWLGLFLVGGGWELLSYLSEGRRLAEHQRRQDLAALGRDKADADLRLAVLQAQIEPHFLFNTLASVRSLVRQEPDRAVATIDALSQYLRSTLPRLRRDVGVESATLGEQIDICARYLDLMNIRTGGRIAVTLDVEGDLRDIAFPPLLLISLVENAVKHGVEPRSGPASITIRARLNTGDGGSLDVDVEDDGVGLSEGAGSGVGLANVRAQLQHRFGARASLTVDNLPVRGVRARISMPADPS